jgi:hypothetical protein
VPVVGGQRYLLRVSNFSEIADGNLVLHASFAVVSAPPANDACSSAMELGTGGTFTGVLCGATGGFFGDCGNGPSAPDVWFRIETGPCAGTMTVDTCGSDFDTVVALFRGACGSPTLVECNDDAQAGPCAGSLQSYFQFQAPANTSYLLRMSNANQTASGHYVLHVDTTAPANDSCAQATPIGTGSTNFDTSCATLDGPTSSCRPTAMAPDLWYSFNAGCTGSLWVDTCGASYDTVLSVHTGSCGNLVELACNDDEGSRCPANGYSSFVAVPVVSGSNYKIRVSGYLDHSGAGTLHVTCCRADVNADGSVNVQDFLAFLQLYAAASNRADVNADGQVNVQDFLSYLQAYAAGC